MALDPPDMDQTVQSLISTLTSSTLPLLEKHNQFYIFIKSLHNSPSDPIPIIDLLLSCIPPSFQNSPFHQQIQLKLAHSFHRHDLILDLLHHGNRRTTAQATKLPWFYSSHNSTKNSLENPAFLLHDLFPQVSIRCRNKLIHGMGRWMRPSNRNIMDTIFDTIQTNCGQPTAMPLLPACSPQKMEQILWSGKFKLDGNTDRLFLAIAKQFPDLCLQYLTQQSEKGYVGYTTCPKTYSHLFHTNLQEFMQFIAKRKLTSYYNYEMPVGRTLAKKFLKNSSPELFLENFQILHTHFCISPLGKKEIRKRMTRDQFAKIVEQSLPPKLEDLATNSIFWKWIDREEIPDAIQFEILEKAILGRYKVSSLLDEICIENLPPEIVAFLPEEDRVKVVENRVKRKKGMKRFSYWYEPNDYSYDGSYLNWTVMKPTKYSIPELDHIFKTEQQFVKRTDHFEYLLMTCWVNQDTDELLRTLQRVVDRVRNDNFDVRSKIMESISKYFVDLPLKSLTKWTSLQISHWKLVLDVIRLIILNNEFRRSIEAIRKLMHQYIIFLFETSHQSHLQPAVHLFLEFVIPAAPTYYSYTSWVIPSLLTDPTHQIQLFQSYLKELEKMYPSSSSLPVPEHASIIESMCRTMVQLHSDFPSQFLDNCDPSLYSKDSWLAHQFLPLLKKHEQNEALQKRKKLSPWETTVGAGWISETATILGFLNSNDPPPLDNILVAEKYLKEFKCQPLLTHFLHLEPTILSNYWEEILQENLGKDDREILNFAALLHREGYPSFISSTVKYCESILMEPKTALTLQKNAAVLLSVLDTRVFLKAIQEFYPTDKLHDISSENSKEDLEIKIVIAKCIGRLCVTQNVDEFGLIFDGIRRFCMGDYLKYITSALYIQSHNIPQREVTKFVQDSMTSIPNVSVKKHLLRLYFLISSLPAQLQMSRKLWEESDHVTIRHETFIQILELFHTLQSEEAYQLLGKVILDLKLVDRMTLNELSGQLSKFPLSFLSSYVRLCVGHMRSVEALEVLRNFLSSLEYVMENVDQETLTWILQTEMSEFKGQYCGFYIKYLLSGRKDGGSSLDLERLEKMGEILKKEIESKWIQTDLEGRYEKEFVSLTRKAISGFVDGLCKNGIEGVLVPKEEETLNYAGERKLAVEVFEKIVKILEDLVPLKCFKLVFNLEMAVLLVRQEKRVEKDLFKNFGKSVMEMIESKVERFGRELLVGMADIVRDFLWSNVPSKFDRKNVLVDVVGGILEWKEKESMSGIVAVKILPYVENPGEAMKERGYEEMWGRIKGFEQPVVQILQWM